MIQIVLPSPQPTVKKGWFRSDIGRLHLNPDKFCPQVGGIDDARVMFGHGGANVAFTAASVWLEVDEY